MSDRVRESVRLREPSDIYTLVCFRPGPSFDSESRAQYARLIIQVAPSYGEAEPVKPWDEMHLHFYTYTV
jgi:hypothetical protein